MIVAEAVKDGVKSAGGAASIYQSVVYLRRPVHHVLTPHDRVPETLSPEVLAKSHAPAKPDYPIITPEILASYDAFIFGIPTYFGNLPGQLKVHTAC